jgi:cytochrome c peroxidase
MRQSDVKVGMRNDSRLIGAALLLWLLLLSGEARAAPTTLFSETFDSAPEGAALEQLAPARWIGRYPAPDPSSAARNGTAVVYANRTLTTVGTFMNYRDSFTRASADMLGQGSLNYRMQQANFGVQVSFDGISRILVISDNLGGYTGQQKSRVFAVNSASGSVHVDVYIQDNRSQIMVTDDLGVQSTPLWQNQRMVGNVPYLLSLASGAYDNVSVTSLLTALPTVGAPRAPLLVTSSLTRGAVGTQYLRFPESWMMDAGITPAQQVRADGGVEPVQYTIINGALPSGLSFSTQYVRPTDDASPTQWLGVFGGAPLTSGSYPITVSATDALGQRTSASLVLSIDPAGPPHISFRDTFAGADGERVHDVTGSPWTGRYGGTTTSAVYERGRASVGTWSTLTAISKFRNADSRYLHVGARMSYLRSGALNLICSQGAYAGILVTYDGNGNVTVLSNNLGYVPQTYRDSFTVSPGPDGMFNADIYLKGITSRTIITGAAGPQATDLRVNGKLDGYCRNGDFTLSLGYGGTYDDIAVDDVTDIPPVVSPVRVDSTSLLRAYEGVSYRDTLAPGGGMPPYTWTVSALPPGLSLAPDGVISGTLTAPSTVSSTFTVTDGVGQTATRTLAIDVEADPAHNLLFADRFTLPDGAWLTARDGAHWASLPGTPGSMSYSAGRMVMTAHTQGWLPVNFPNDGVTPLQFRFWMTKGRVTVAEPGTGFGMQVEYDGVQHVSLRWNDMYYGPYMLEQDFLLESNGEAIYAAIEVKGDQFGLRVEDSMQTYLRGPYAVPRVTVGKPVSIHFRENTPYKEFQFTSYQSGPSYFDDLTVRRGVSTVAAGSLLRQREQLGQLLFFDRILSGDQSRSCADCHRPDAGFTDARVRALGLDGSDLPRNTPGVANLALVSAFFWDGRETSLDRVALQPIQNPLEMNNTRQKVESSVQSIRAYRNSFSALFPDGVTIDNISAALGAYMRTLMELRTPYDAHIYAAGVLSADEDAGQILFKGKANCVTCHTLSPVRRVGLNDYAITAFESTGVPLDATFLALDDDAGRAPITGNANDFGVFRVPGLRGLSATGPYMHNGIFDTLEQVVAFYNAGGGVGFGLSVPNQSLQVAPLGLTAVEQQQLVAFLRALSPEFPNFVEVPTSVPSGLPVGIGQFRTTALSKPLSTRMKRIQKDYLSK